MTVLAALLGLAFLMLIAYRGFSVILFAPVAAMIPVLLTAPDAIPTIFTNLFMAKAVAYVQLYFPIFLLGAVFGKMIEISGFCRAIVVAVIRLIGPRHAILCTVLATGILTYGGVSVFVVVFAVYPFAAELYRQADIPKRLIPGALALGAFSFSMDALPGTPQIQNIIPTTYFQTTAWSAPVLGVIGGVFMFVIGMAFLEWRRRAAGAEGYGEGHSNEPVGALDGKLVNPLLAISPLLMVGVLNLVLTRAIPLFYGPTQTVKLPGLKDPVVSIVPTVTAIWALEAALIVGILMVAAFAWRPVKTYFMDASRIAVGGALLAIMNTASEVGFGGVIAALPGFVMVRDALHVIPNPLVNAAITTTTLAGITGSASGGLGIALAAMSEHFIAMAHQAHIPLEVLHRVTAMAAGGMDDLPHNGAVITILAVTGLTHRQAYKPIFAVTIIKTIAVMFVIGVYYSTGLV